MPFRGRVGGWSRSRFIGFAWDSDDSRAGDQPDRDRRRRDHHPLPRQHRPTRAGERGHRARRGRLRHLSGTRRSRRSRATSWAYGARTTASIFPARRVSSRPPRRSTTRRDGGSRTSSSSRRATTRSPGCSVSSRIISTSSANARPTGTALPQSAKRRHRARHKRAGRPPRCRRPARRTAPGAGGRRRNADDRARRGLERDPVPHARVTRDRLRCDLRAGGRCAATPRCSSRTA